MDGSGVHCGVETKFQTEIANKRPELFPDTVVLNKELFANFRSFYDLHPVDVSPSFSQLDASLGDNNMPVRVLNIVQSLYLGGAVRCMAAAAKYSQRQSAYQHTVVGIDPIDDPYPAQYMHEQELTVLSISGIEAIADVMNDYDIIVLHWWNNPEVNDFLRRKLPPSRLAIWAHVGGMKAPQLVTPQLVERADFFIAGSPLTYRCPPLHALPEETRLAKVGMAYDPTDFEKLESFTRNTQEQFTVGYVGTVSFIKMHEHYVAMNAAVNIPDVRFVVCGGGEAVETIKQQVESRGLQSKFDIRGHTEDVLSALQTFDVFGYPLCEDNYAAAELVLQEVMYLGIPPVVFPYGGVKYLVHDNFTGLVVHGEQEYAEAIEYLYHNPDERKRLGENARRYAKQIFGAENAAKAYNRYLSQMMKSEKTVQESATQVMQHGGSDGNRIFLATIGEAATPFHRSAKGQDIDSLLQADREIMKVTELMRVGGIQQYRRYYPSDPMLHFWFGLTSLAAKEYHEALQAFSDALNTGFTHWRALWYLALTARQMGFHTQAEELFAQLQGVDTTERKKLEASFSLQ